MENIVAPWPWYIGGPIIGLIMIVLILLGKTFGFSSNFRTICAAMGAGKKCSFFKFDWKTQSWNILFLIGSIIGGFLSAQFLSDGQVPQIADHTITELRNLGFKSAGYEYYPKEIFDIFTLKNFLILATGGLLIGFGTRYAGGCTSGHAIAGLSNLQWPSLIAVIGFFIGGLVMVHLLFPILF